MEQLLPVDVLQVDVGIASLGVMDFHKRLVNQNLSCSLGGYKMIILISQKSITRKQRNKNIEMSARTEVTSTGVFEIMGQFLIFQDLL